LLSFKQKHKGSNDTPCSYRAGSAEVSCCTCSIQTRPHRVYWADQRMSKLSESKAVCIVPPGAGYLDI
jgi:hypothetical protein